LRSGLHYALRFASSQRIHALASSLSHVVFAAFAGLLSGVHCSCILYTGGKPLPPHAKGSSGLSAMNSR